VTFLEIVKHTSANNPFFVSQCTNNIYGYARLWQLVGVIVSCANTAEPIEMPSGMLSGIGTVC